jgi:hypothetical protein
MNIRHVAIGIVVLVIICSPALAISKSDLMTYYRTTPFSPTNFGINPEPTEEITPLNPMDLPASPIIIVPFSTLLKPIPMPAIPSSGIEKPRIPSSGINKSVSTGYVPEPPSIHVSKLNQEDDCFCGPSIPFTKVEE